MCVTWENEIRLLVGQGEHGEATVQNNSGVHIQVPVKSAHYK